MEPKMPTLLQYFQYQQDRNAEHHAHCSYEIVFNCIVVLNLTHINGVHYCYGILVFRVPIIVFVIIKTL